MRVQRIKQIDEKDQSILRLLQANARMSNKAIADHVGLSENACLERVRKLERAGIIRGYHAHVSPDFNSRPFEVWANIALLDLPQATQQAFQTLIGACTDVVSAYQLSGAFDCVVHFAAEEALAWRAFCSQLTAIGVGAERVSFGLIVGAQKRGSVR